MTDLSRVNTKAFRIRTHVALRTIMVASAALLAAQSNDTESWAAAAGGKIKFDAASVRPAVEPKLPAFPLDSRAAKTAGGNFSAAFPLSAFIMFAYKLEPWEMSALVGAPKWVVSELFEIEATAKGNPTKDQMRLMMQSLLAERFKLAVHIETREMPVLALSLATPGRTGPKLRPHAEGPPCSEFFEPQPRDMAHDPSGIFPKSCDTAEAWGKPDGTWLAGSRNTTMEQLAAQIFSGGRVAGEIDRPVVDRTGLAGRFDFTLEYGPQSSDELAKLPAVEGTSPNAVRMPFRHALREHLGLHLVPSTAPIRSLIIDHVEKPSAK